MLLKNGTVQYGCGGGLCQLSNLIFWMTLHTPLEVKERHRHGYDVFPDSNRTQPFGSGAIVIVLLVRMFLFGFYVIPSGSMLNTIEPGDRVITSKLTPKVFKLQRGDVVVFKDPDHWLQQENSGRFGGDYLIKRLIGLPGDTVACEGPGKPVTVNGVAIDETSYIRSGVDPSSFAFSEKVTAGHVFVMGDNRANSADSRYHQDDSSHGLVPVSDVVGVGLVKYWPLNHISTLDAHHDVFRDVPEGSTD